MKKLSMALLAMFVGMSVMGCSSKDCLTTLEGDNICIYHKDLHQLRMAYSITKIYKNGKLNNLSDGTAAVRNCDYFGEFGLLCRYEDYQDGLRHNCCNSAVRSFLGEEEWWVEGKKYTYEEFKALQRESLSDQLEALTKQQEKDTKNRGEIR